MKKKNTDTPFDAQSEILKMARRLARQYKQVDTAVAMLKAWVTERKVLKDAVLKAACLKYIYDARHKIRRSVKWGAISGAVSSYRKPNASRRLLDDSYAASAVAATAKQTEQKRSLLEDFIMRDGQSLAEWRCDALPAEAERERKEGKGHFANADFFERLAKLGRKRGAVQVKDAVRQPEEADQIWKEVAGRYKGYVTAAA